MKIQKNSLAVSSSLVVLSIILLIAVASTFAVLYGFGGRTTTSVTTSTVTVAGETSTKTVYYANSSGSSSSGLNAIEIYNRTRPSIVTVQGTQNQSSVFGVQTVSVLGSGFVVNYGNSDYVVTNYHVAGATSNLTVTFSDGNSYAASLVGSDPYVDLAVLSVESAPSSEFHVLQLVPSSTLLVGAPVVVIGNPFGLSGSMTFGIISALGRTLQDPTAGNFSIADVIQFSAPINPGNSGGPLLDSSGQVVGITTAVVSGSQGVGFAIPSDAIIKELPSLISTGTYTEHSYLGIQGSDMNYQLAKAINTNYTYGVLVASTIQGSPAAQAGLRGGNTLVIVNGQQYLIGGDIIVSINGTKIVDNDALAAYLQEYTVPGQTVVLGILRAGSYTTVQLTLGARPQP
ncbi:MAG: trypsin-like peptidase domain-containing protein [Nitrososphaerota archaeon]|nr:trypsin-like peptidase domain-containing protein [Nitrososphaerota archaeon]